MTDNDAPMQRMLPCPFCGGNAEYQTNKGPTGELYGWVGCTQCGAASDQCDVRSMQPEEIHPIDAWSARVTSPCDGRTEQLLKDVEGVANLLAQWRTTVMCRFDGSVDGDQWRELNKAFDDLATVRAALRTTPQAKPLDLPAQDEVGRPKGAGWSTPPEMEADHDERLTKAELKALGLGVSEWAYNHLSKGYAVSLTVREVKRLLATTAIAALDRHRAGDDVRMVTGQLNITFAEFLEYAQENLILEKAGIADMPDFLQPEAVDALREENARLRAVVDALAVLMPIQVHDGRDYAEVFFADGATHSTQAMTMNPQHWRDLADAYDRAALTGRQG